MTTTVEHPQHQEAQSPAITATNKRSAVQQRAILHHARENRLAAEALHVRRVEDRWRLAREQEFARSGWAQPGIWARINAIADSNITAAIIYLAIVLSLVGVALGWINP